jgi:hypothetical protein
MLSIERAMSRTKREQTLQAFFQERLLCPWGREAAREGRITYADAGKFKTLCKDVRTFLSRGPGTVLVAVAPVDLWTHQAVERKAREMFVDLFMVRNLLSGTTATRSEVSAFSDVPPGARPLLDFEERLLFTIAMSPHYPEGHPRRAPHLLLSSTWGTDVVPLKKTASAAVSAVLDRRAALFGELYDSDELVLPLAA